MNHILLIEAVIPQVIIHYLEGGEIIDVAKPFGQRSGRRAEYRLAERIAFKAILHMPHGTYGQQHLLSGQGPGQQLAVLPHNLRNREPFAAETARRLFVAVGRYPAAIGQTVDPRGTESQDDIIGSGQCSGPGRQRRIHRLQRFLGRRTRKGTVMVVAEPQSASTGELPRPRRACLRPDGESCRRWKPD